MAWAPGLLAFTDSGSVRTATVAGAVTTIAGTPLGLPWLDDLFTYDVALRENRILVGSPRSLGTFTGTERSGRAWVLEWTDITRGEIPSTVIPPRNAAPLSRYGATVAFTSNGDAVLGPANGCLWVAPGVCGDDDPSHAAETAPVRIFRADTEGRWLERAVLPITGISPGSGYGQALATDGRWLVVGAPQYDYRPQDGPPWYGTPMGPGVVYVYDLESVDSDSDGMTDTWEERFGLDPADPADRLLDADGDGVTNLEEHGQYTHPRNDPAFTRYFAEGATSDFFETRFALANPNNVPATVALRFMSLTRCCPSIPISSGTTLTLPPRASRKVVLPLDAYLGRADFSTAIESDHEIVADRLMTWDRVNRYGSHGERATVSPSPTWYFAEGATHSGFDVFYLLQNPGAQATDVRVTYLRAAAPPLTKTYSVAARSRLTVWVNTELFTGDEVQHPALSHAEFSAIVESLDATPIIVERAMYQSRAGGRSFETGHASAGVTAPANRWYFAEGATGDFFDLYLLLANPSDAEVTVRGTYLRPDGRSFTKLYAIAPNRRFTVLADEEQFDGEPGRPLADTAVSTTFEVVSGGPIIAERAMWWPGPTYLTWTEAHNSAGATETGFTWAVAEGEVVDAPMTDTYYLIANPTPEDAHVSVTLLFEDGSTPVEAWFVVPASSRFNVDVRSAFPEAAGKRFGAVVTSHEMIGLPGVYAGYPKVPIVVEWSIYSDAMGQFWAAGANALATKLN